MDDAGGKLISKYQEHGVIEAGVLLLSPDNALRFADELLAINIGVLGLELWFRAVFDGHERLVEYPWSPEYSRFVRGQNFAELSVNEAKRYIADDLPEEVTLVGFVF